MPPVPKGFDTMVKRIRIGNDEKQRKKDELKNIGKPKVNVKEFLDENGQTVAKPFNFLSEVRPERLKDKREGHKRDSIDTSYAIKFGLREINSVVSNKHVQSPLARKVQQAGKSG